MNRLQTKALIEAAIFAGITALLGIIYYYIPTLGIIAMVWPVPAIIVGYRNGLKASILSAISAGLIVSLLTHPFVGLGLLLGFGFPGIVMVYMINKRINPHVTVIVCGLLLSVTIVGESVLSAMASGIDVMEVIPRLDAAFKQSLETAMNISRQQGFPESDLIKMNDSFIKLWDYLKIVFPSGALIMGIVFSFADYKLTGLVLKRVGHNIPDIENFSKWRLKEPYSFVLLGLAVLAAAIQYFKITSLTTVAFNISYLLTFIFYIIGISVVVHFARVYGDKQGVPKGFRNVIVTFIALAFAQFLAIAGILDMVLDFRKLESKGSGGVR